MIDRNTCGNYSYRISGIESNTTTPDKNYVPIDFQFCRAVQGRCPFSAVNRETSESLVSEINKFTVPYSPEHDSGSAPPPFHRIFPNSLSLCPNACSQPQIADIGIIGAVKPEITDAPCSGCGRCLRACRENAITVANDNVAVHSGCLYCGMCISGCRSGTLTVEYEGFRILLGGKLGRHPMPAKELPGIYPASETSDIISRSIQFYLVNRTPNARFGGTQVGYHDNASPLTSDPEWSSGSALCIMHMTSYYPAFTELISKTDGVVRDPCISFDGKKVLFAMSDSANGTGGVHFTFQNPYPLDEESFLVSWRKSETVNNYKLYFMDADGNRELLAWADQSVSQPVVVRPWKKIPPRLAELANYNDSMGTFSLQDVYYGEGMKGIDKASGIAKRLRVVKLHYRAMGAGWSGSSVTGSAPSGSFAPTILGPVSQYGASWDVKEVLGEATIYPDGSTSFKVPARTPVYFQVLDSSGYCIATMRSWSTLMPGETFSCTGCHENKNEAPPSGYNPQGHVFQTLDTSLGIENRPFDYREMVQPIFDKHCVSCHTKNHPSGFDLRGDLVGDTGTKKSWTRSYSSLLKGIGAEPSNRALSICTIFSKSEQRQPYSFGSSQSGIMNALNGSIPAMKEIHLTEKEKRIIACWIDLAAPHSGSYTGTMSLSDTHFYDSLAEKRERWAAVEAEGLRELAKLQPAIAPEISISAKPHSTPAECSGIGYIPAQRALVLRSSAPGTVVVVDVRGRTIFRMKVSPHHTGREVTISLPAGVRTGLYIATFAGMDETVPETGISIVQLLNLTGTLH